MHPSERNQRRHPRVVIDLAVRLSREETETTARVVDIARGGAFVRTRRPAAVGSPVRLRLRTLATKSCEAGGRVVWRRPTVRPGFGVCFDDTNEAMQMFVRSLERLSLPLRSIYLADVIDPHVEVDEATTT